MRRRRWPSRSKVRALVLPSLVVFDPSECVWLVVGRSGVLEHGVSGSKTEEKCSMTKNSTAEKQPSTPTERRLDVASHLPWHTRVTWGALVSAGQSFVGFQGLGPLPLPFLPCGAVFHCTLFSAPLQQKNCACERTRPARKPCSHPCHRYSTMLLGKL